MGALIVRCTGCAASVPLKNLQPASLDAWFALHQDCPRPGHTVVLFEILERSMPTSQERSAHARRHPRTRA